MKKRILSAITAGILLVATTMPVMEAKAVPSEVEQARSEYEELTNKINGINEKIQMLDAEINPLVVQMNENKTKIESINTEIENTNKEIEQAQKNISEQEEVLGDRLREVYKSGGELNFLNVIFSADSLSDLISKVTSAKTVLDLDNEIIQDLNEQKDKLDEKVESLETKTKEIVKLNNEISDKKEELEDKKSEQQSLVAQAEAEQKEFDSKYLAQFERDLVSGFIATATNSNSSKSALQQAKTNLKGMLAQLKSPTVISEVNNAINKASSYISQKEEAERLEREQAAANSPSRGDNGSTNSSNSSSSGTVSGSVQAVLDEAYKHAGKWYEYGATGPNTFDCSGFTSYVYKKATGIYIGRTTFDQINAGVEVSYSELKPGDLVFPHSGHVGIYVGNGQMIHAPQTGKQIQVAPVYKFWRARRILN